MISTRLNIALVGLYSVRYPAIGETHALSVLAGCLREAALPQVAEVLVFDMVGLAAESTAELLAFATFARPSILGISVTYGTYDFLRSSYSRLRGAIPDNALVVFGGPLASYLPELILREIDDTAIVVIGEGEEAFMGIVRNSISGEDVRSVPGVASLQEGHFQRIQRTLTDVTRLPPPSRAHIPALHRKKAQIFIESSRGCSWATCTFCLRRLTDINGTSAEYRNFSEERTISDLSTLRSLGVSHVTFADEDFWGSSLARAEYITGILKRYADTGMAMRFDVSMTPHSVWTRSMARSESDRRRELLGHLVMAGLRKVFLGIESGSKSQLKRYAKGHCPDDLPGAIGTLRGLGIEIETGWIMFDPLCTIAELAENISFLKENDLAKHTSFLFSEIRIQKGSSYMRMVRNVEKRLGLRIMEDEIDPNTLSYGFAYVEPDVARIVDVVRTWSKRLHRVHYPIKNLSRFGVTGPLGPVAVAAGDQLLELRVRLLNCLEALGGLGPVSERRANLMFDEAIRCFGESILELVSTLDSASQSHPRIVFARQQLSGGL